ncbi:MAG: peptide deformylase [Parcubacteria group bacterium]|nr:peptide deformylase [Parcubacteria group bacterium]
MANGKFLPAKNRKLNGNKKFMVREILKEPNPLLRKKSEAVLDASKKEIQDLISDMKETMKKAEGVGLAAPQIGINLRVAVMEVNQHSYVIINPEIKKLSNEKIISEEGCLSVPDIWGLVERSKKIIIKGQNEKGEFVKIYGSGLLARVIQHELDHLNGILFIDKTAKISKIQKREAVEL